MDLCTSIDMDQSINISQINGEIEKTMKVADDGDRYSRNSYKRDTFFMVSLESRAVCYGQDDDCGSRLPL